MMTLTTKVAINGRLSWRATAGLTSAGFPCYLPSMTEITIDALGQQGDGIAEMEGGRVFVPFTLPGERVEIAREGERGTLLRVIVPSPDRVVPESPYFGRCGGCALQHMAPGAYAAFKRELVVSALTQVAPDVPVAPLVPAWGSGRRRATLHVRKDAAGYMRARSHDVLDIEACAILVPMLRSAAPRIGRALHRLAGDCDVHFTATDSGIDLSIRSPRKLKPAALAEFARTHRLARVTFNGDTMFMAQPPQVTMGRAQVELPPGSFLQATALAEDELGRLVLEGLGGAKKVADLFCGLGPFALRIAPGARVFAADSDRAAVAALDKAARHATGFKPLETRVRDLFRDPLAPIELQAFDAVVFDPPRAGAEAQARELAQSRVKTVVGVSCDPRSFARDAAILIGGGYRLMQVTPVDQFAYSAHVELVGVFRR